MVEQFSSDGTAVSVTEKDAQHETVAGALDAPGLEKSPRKTLSFYMTFLALNISTFIVSLDATALAVAIPVRLHNRMATPGIDSP